jgi:hypothetical protein
MVRPAAMTTWRSSGPDGAVAVPQPIAAIAHVKAHTSLMDLF